MSESESDGPAPGPEAASGKETASLPDVGSQDLLAEKLLAVQRVLATFEADSETRIRLNLRFMAICTSMKMPGANTARGIRRLDRLMAEAELARRGNGKQV
jgi:hypothetical protein